MNALQLEQGSPDWLKAKLGVISASNISKVLAKKGSETRHGYMMELIGQIATREPEEFNAKQLEWGKANEAAARAEYEFQSGNNVETAGFIYGPDKRAGCSPDGMITGLNRGVEIKCPFTSRVHADFLLMDKIKPEYVLQCQFSMWVTGFDSWDFCSYHARFKSRMLKSITLERDIELMKRFEDEVGQFIFEMDEHIKRLNLKFGEQWE
jgi:predicted phage-related endonuclease